MAERATRERPGVLPEAVYQGHAEGAAPSVASAAEARGEVCQPRVLAVLPVLCLGQVCIAQE